MEGLPDLPFEKMLSYLSLQDLIRSRAVSRAWLQMIDSFRVKSLCYSPHPMGFIAGKVRWISGTFAQNFIFTTRFPTFVHTFGSTILSNLKQLRLCGFSPNITNLQTLRSFERLEKLDLISVISRVTEFELNMPMLISIHLERVRGIEKLTLDAPRLCNVKLLSSSSLRLDLVHGEPVESLNTDDLNHVEVRKLKNLKKLYTGASSEIDSTLLFSLEQLKEVHLNNKSEVSKIFDQKERYGFANLKIFLGGLLLNGRNDPAANFSSETIFYCLVENPARMADEIPLNNHLPYSLLDGVAPRMRMNVLSRCPHLNSIVVNRPVRDTQRFLDFLKTFATIAQLRFEGDQPQDLFDRLPEHCAVQILFIRSAPSNFQFLVRLNHLISLKLNCEIFVDSIRKVFQALPYLSQFEFRCNNRNVRIEVPYPTEFRVVIDGKSTNVTDLISAIQLIFAPPEKKRGADHLLE